MKNLKKITVFTLLLTAFGIASLKAQDRKTVATKTQVIEASADEVWERLRKLDGLEEIIPNFLADSWLVGDAKAGVGVKRSCTAPGGEKGQASYTEQIVDFDDDQRYYSYAVIEGIPAKNMLNSFRVVDLGYNKCMVVWNAAFESFMKNPNMTEEQFVGFINSAGDAMMAGLHKLHNGKS